MKLTRKRIEECVSVGDIIYLIQGSKIIPSAVIEICDDGIETMDDFLFYDEHLFTWTLLESTAKTLLTRANNP